VTPILLRVQLAAHVRRRELARARALLFRQRRVGGGRGRGDDGDDNALSGYAGMPSGFTNLGFSIDTDKGQWLISY
jgi:hypothetical protein